MSSSRVFFFLAAALGGGLSGVAHGHGYGRSPRSNNYLASLAGNDSCPHCHNGGTQSVVQLNTPADATTNEKLWKWPPTDQAYEEARHGLCGGIAGFGLYEPPGEIVAENVYEEGGIMDVEVYITAHHNGHIEFRLCELLGADLSATTCPAPGVATQTCLNEHILLRTGTDTDKAGADQFPDMLGPGPDDMCLGAPQQTVDGSADQFDPCYPERYYLNTRKDTPRDKGNWLLRYGLQLPPDLVCQHCILQMYYVTGNSCHAPGYRPAIEAFTSVSSAACGESEEAYPEEFWNCASVAVLPAGSIPAPPPVSSFVETACSKDGVFYSEVSPGGGGDPPPTSECGNWNSRIDCNAAGGDCRWKQNLGECQTARRRVLLRAAAV